MPTQELLKGHKSFKTEFNQKQDFFKKLAVDGQKPKVLWIGCSDSRVIPEQIMNTSAGELFVHRNIANIIPPKSSKETCTASVIEYAVNALKVNHIVICGHTECGGIQAVMNGFEPSDQSGIAIWLRNAQHANERSLKDNDTKQDRYLNTIKQNILLQKEHLLSHDYIKQQIESGILNIHLWLYDIHDGTILQFEDNDQKWEPIK